MPVTDHLLGFASADRERLDSSRIRSRRSWAKVISACVLYVHTRLAGGAYEVSGAGASPASLWWPPRGGGAQISAYSVILSWFDRPAGGGTSPAPWLADRSAGCCHGIATGTTRPWVWPRSEGRVDRLLPHRDTPADRSPIGSRIWVRADSNLTHKSKICSLVRNPRNECSRR